MRFLEDGGRVLTRLELAERPRRFWTGVAYPGSKPAAEGERRKGWRGDTPVSAAMEFAPGNQFPSGAVAPGVYMPPCAGPGAPWLPASLEDEESMFRQMSVSLVYSVGKNLSALAASDKGCITCDW